MTYLKFEMTTSTLVYDASVNFEFKGSTYFLRNNNSMKLQTSEKDEQQKTRNCS